MTGLNGSTQQITGKLMCLINSVIITQHIYNSDTMLSVENTSTWFMDLILKTLNSNESMLNSGSIKQEL
jgi:hypothetical protein